MTGKIYRPEQKHPLEYQDELSPEASKGVNYGTVGDAPQQSAVDVKELHDLLSDFSTDELRQFTVLNTGDRLETGATYLNLKDPARHEFRAEGNEEVRADEMIVAKKEVPYQLWNRLCGQTTS